MRLAANLKCLVATLLGFIAGLVFAGKIPAAGTVPETVRAVKFELTDKSGNTIAVWGTDENNQVTLSFRGNNKTELATVGIASDQLPFIKLLGKEGKPRVFLGLFDGEKPLLGMSDNEYEGRVLLGFLQQDTFSPKDDNWGLLFRSHSTDPFASIGMIRSFKDGSLSGAFRARDSSGKSWSAP